MFILSVSVVLVTVTHAQWTGGASLGVGNKGPDLKLSVGRTAGKWTFKGWGSTDFSGGWKAGVSVGIKFKRSTHDVSLLSYSQTIEEIPTVFLYNDKSISFMDHSSISITFKEYHVTVINPCLMLIFRFYRSIIYSSKQTSAILMFMMKTGMES